MEPILERAVRERAIQLRNTETNYFDAQRIIPKEVWGALKGKKTPIYDLVGSFPKTASVSLGAVTGVGAASSLLLALIPVIGQILAPLVVIVGGFIVYRLKDQIRSFGKLKREIEPIVSEVYRE